MRAAVAASPKSTTPATKGGRPSRCRSRRRRRCPWGWCAGARRAARRGEHGHHANTSGQVRMHPRASRTSDPAASQFIRPEEQDHPRHGSRPGRARRGCARWHRCVHGRPSGRPDQRHGPVSSVRAPTGTRSRGPHPRPASARITNRSARCIKPPVPVTPTASPRALV